MTKTQAWIVIGLLVALVALWLIHNSNEAQSTVNRTVGCDSICYDKYTASPQATSDTDQLHSCINACHAQNGL